MAGNRTIIVLSAAATLLMIGVGMIVALLPQRVHAETGSLESVGMVASVFAFAYLLAQLPAGVLADRFGAKPLLVTGYALCAVAGVMFWNSGTAGGIYLGRAVQGLGEAPVWALGPAMLSLAYPAAKGRAIGIYNAAIHIGLTMGPVIGLLLDPSGLGGTPFLLFSAFCVAGAIVVAVFLPRMSAGPVLAETGRPTLRGAVGLLVHRPSLVVLAGIVLYGGCYGAFLSVLPITAAALKGFGPRDISVFFVVFYAAISVSQLVAGPLSDRHGRTPFMIGGLVLAIVGLAAFLLSPAVMAYVSLAISSFGLGVFCVASLAKLNDTAPEHLKGTVSGGYYFAWALGYVLGPLMVGALDPVSPATGYWILCALMTGQVVALLTIRDIRA